MDTIVIVGLLFGALVLAFVLVSEYLWPSEAYYTEKYVIYTEDGKEVIVYETRQ